MKSYLVKILGSTPYMQHRMDDISLDAWEKKRGEIVERADVSKADAVRAEYHCYRNKAGSCYIPADQLRGAMITAGTYIKAKVGSQTKSMKSIVAAQFMIGQDEIPMPDYDAIDKRSAVNRNVKARVITIRPKWTNWEATFKLIIRNDSLTEETIKKVIEYAGSYVGIGSFRPTNNGMFGQFEVQSMTPITEK